MNVLVTGAAGFIGSTLLDRLLADGHRVVGVDCFTDYYERAVKEQNLTVARQSSHFTFVEADLLDVDLEPLMSDAEVVFHLAGCPGVRSSWGNQFEQYLQGNVLATQRLLEQARTTDVHRVVYSSSSSVYGNPDHFPSSEDDVPQPISPYGVTKLAAEHLCTLYQRNYGVPTVSLRYFTVYGPRQRPDMAIRRLIEAARRGSRFTLFGDGSFIRDFTFVDDVVEANILAATVPKIEGTVINVGGGTNVSMAQLIEAVERESGREIDVVTSDTMKGDVTRTQACTKRSLALLGWQPNTSIDEGLRRQVNHLGI